MKRRTLCIVLFVILALLTLGVLCVPPLLCPLNSGLFFVDRITYFWSDVECEKRCKSNLHLISGAKQCFAESKGVPKGSIVIGQDIELYLKHGLQDVYMQCPSGGKYALNPIGVAPTCSVVGHELSTPE